MFLLCGMRVRGAVTFKLLEDVVVEGFPALGFFIKVGEYVFVFFSSKTVFIDDGPGRIKQNGISGCMMFFKMLEFDIHTDKTFPVF